MREDFTIGVTLFVNGSVVSGSLINYAAYLKGMAEILETPYEEQEPTNIAKLMSKGFRELAENATGEDDVIYLKDLTFWSLPIPKQLKEHS